MDTRISGGRSGRRDSGMTVIEVVIALGMMTMVLGAAGMYVRASLVSARARFEQRVAHEVALSRIELLRSPAGSPLESASPSIATADPASISQLGNATCAWSVEEYAAFAGVKKVTVTVRWNGGRGTRRVTHVALVRRGGER